MQDSLLRPQGYSRRVLLVLRAVEKGFQIGSVLPRRHATSITGHRGPIVLVHDTVGAPIRSRRGRLECIALQSAAVFLPALCQSVLNLLVSCGAEREISSTLDYYDACSSGRPQRTRSLIAA